MALTVGDREVHPFTAEDVLRMADAGILGEDDRVELLAGVLTTVSPKSPAHGTLIARLVRWLVTSDPGGRYAIRTEHPLRVPDRRSLPEPDIAVVDAGAVRAGEHPTTATLVVEVAVTSLRTEAEIKAPLYAAAGVPELWVVDVPGRRVLVFDDPADGRYRRERTVERGPLTPRALDAPPLELAALLAGV